MKRFITARTLIATAVAFIVIGSFYVKERSLLVSENFINTANAGIAAVVTLPFTYAFHVDGRLEETGIMENSSSPYWWVSSGAFLDLKTGIGMTNHDDAARGSKWQVKYAANNPVDTDDGLHPQNIFRMTSRTTWRDVGHEVSYRIDRNNLSTSPSRNASNGLLQMTRYVDQNNLYFTGLRVDGYAVIKKKISGRYYTMAYKPVISGKKYHRDTNPNLLPSGTWIRLKTVTKNLDAKRVSIKFYVDIGKTGAWTLAAEAIDDGVSYGGAALTDAGYSGVRTDFMDVSIDDFRLANVH